MAESRVAGALRTYLRLYRGDLVALVGVSLLALAFVAPSVVDGGTFGNFDLDTTLTPLGHGLYPSIHNIGNGDAVSQMISWNTLDWRMIHAGHFPLWNDYSGLGMPEFLNFESSVLSLPDLVSYLAPLREAFLVVVVVKFAIAGTGAYAFARVVGVRVPAALFAAVTFMFSGAFANWITWPLSDVVAWTGWIAALAMLAYRSRRKLSIVLLAFAVAFSILGGFPEANVMVALILGTFFVAAGAASWAYGRRPSMPGAARASVGVVAGVALASPLWFPGLQVIAGSHRTTEGHYPGLPMKSLPLLFSQGYLGEPFAGGTHFGLTSWNYYEATAYIGVPALALAIVALLGARRKPVVIGLGVALFVGFVASYDAVGLSPFFHIVNRIAGLDELRFERTKAVAGLVVAVLGAIGFDECWSAVADRRVLRRQWIAFGAIAVVVVAVTVRTFASSTTGILPQTVPHRRALIAPLVLVALLLVVGAIGAAALRRSPTMAPRFQRAGMVAILVGQCAFVFLSGVGIPTYSHTFYAATAAELRLKATVGDALVGLDGGNSSSVKSFGHVGIYPEVNIGYGVRLFAIHDPVLPTAYFTSWPYPSAAPSKGGVAQFVPDVNSAAIARRYGISFILAGPNLPPPTGTTKVGTFADETLYRVPGAARFAFSSGSGRVTGVSGSTTTGFSMTTSAPTSSRLVMRVTAEPGWHVAIDGKPAPSEVYDDVMESVVVPAGTHTVTLRYFPSRLRVGLLVALVTLLAALVWWGVSIARRRRSRTGERQEDTTLRGAGG